MFFSFWEQNLQTLQPKEAVFFNPMTVRFPAKINKIEL